MDLLDRYAALDSPLHRLDARAKTVALLGYVLCVVLLPAGAWTRLAALTAVLLVAMVLSRVPLLWLLSRALPLLPLIAFTAIAVLLTRPQNLADALPLGALSVSRQTAVWATTASWKSLLSVLAAATTVCTTGVADFLAALGRLRVPALLVTIMTFALRYTVVVGDEARRMVTARDVRGTPPGLVRRMRLSGSMAGTLFVRSYERSERVGGAMVARGFDGTLRTLAPPPLTWTSAAAAASFLAVAAAASLLLP